MIVSIKRTDKMRLKYAQVHQFYQNIFYLFSYFNSVKHWLNALMLLYVVGHACCSFSFYDNVSYQKETIQVSQKSMVVTEHAVATQIGLDILRRGGNAIDAAVAVGFALATLLPHEAGLGGGGGMLLYIKKQNQTVALNYYNKKPQQFIKDSLVVNTYPSSGHSKKKLPHQFSYQSVAIPGTVAGLWAVHCRYGQLPWKVLLAPAVKIAYEGVILTEEVAFAIAKRHKILSKDTTAAHIFFKKNRTLYQTGDLIRQLDLAWSLKQIQKDGMNAFYKGSVAKKLIHAIQKNGGLITLQDLMNYRVKWETPIWSCYRCYQIASMPPPFSGLILAMTMQLLQCFPIKVLKQQTQLSIHILQEIFKITRQDFRRASYDYRYWKVLKQNLNDQSKITRRANQIKHLTFKKIASNDRFFQHNSQHTTHYSIADRYGNMVSNTHTLSSTFGAHVVPSGTGILLNNSLRNDASGEKCHAMTHLSSSITPIIVFKENKPWLITGAAGGKYIVPIIAQVLFYLIDHQLDLATATLQPRFFQDNLSSFVELEKSFPIHVAHFLKTCGHQIKFVKAMGSLQSILVEKGLLSGYSDKRRSNTVAKGL